MSLLDGIAHAKRNAARIQRQKYIKDCSISMSLWLLDKYPENIGPTHIWSAWATDWTPEEKILITVKATHRAFGDPMAHYKDNIRLHSTLYHNPTVHTLNIAPMGLPDEEGKVMTTVQPDSLVHIPTIYAKGGAHSTIAQVVPQLRPVPKLEHRENLLDLSPATFGEWINYFPMEDSECCGKMIVWSNAKQALVCLRCKASCVVGPGKC